MRFLGRRVAVRRYLFSRSRRKGVRAVPRPPRLPAILLSGTLPRSGWKVEARNIQRRHLTASQRADIAQNGQLEEIVTHEGRILDGRHRARVCRELGLVVRRREWAGECGSPLAYVLSQNLRRRHLTSSQRAMLVLELLPELKKQARQRQGTRTDLGAEMPESARTGKSG